MSRARQYELDRELNQRLRSTKMTDTQTVKDFFFSMSQNIMTPDFVKAGGRKDFNIIYEVTKGVAFTGEYTYGLSVYEWNGEEYERSDKSQMYHTLEALTLALKEL